MPGFSWSYGSGHSKPKKKWRYPGVPIPFRLQHRYKP
jgi:hypothetical protein